MKAVLKYLLVVFVFASYFQSALEINNDYISNTFNDDHDIYIHSKDFSSQTIIKAEHQTNVALLPAPIFDVQILHARFCFIPFTSKANNTFEQKLFLKNRSLLI
jgi:hypothetical protein